MADPLSLGTALSVGTEIVQNAVNWGSQKRQNDFQLQLWHMNNEYNSPKNQMKRFVEAGLNPHLIYGQGSAGNSGSPPSTGQPPQVDLSTIGNAIKMYLDLKSLDTEIEGKAYDNVTKSNKAILSDWGIKGTDPSGLSIDQFHEDSLPPMVQEMIKKNRLLQKGLDKHDLDKQHSEFDLEQKRKMEFLNDDAKRRYDTYDILPDDPENVQFWKYVGKDIFGMKWPEFREFLLDYLPFRQK